MAGECVVKVPKYSVYDDYDFIGFSFNGYHCVEDLNILRVNGGSMYSENLTPQIQEKSGQHPGVEGAYLLDIQHRQKVFDVNIAFDSLTDEQLYKLKEVFAGKEMGELWFDEYPYKVWDAKVTGQPILKVIPFGDDDGPTIYKGEGTIQFTAYYPYAHTPDFVHKDDVSQGDGRLLDSYNEFRNKSQWSDASGLWEQLYGTAGEDEKLDIRGEAPAWFEGEFKYYNNIGDLFAFTINNALDEYGKPANPVFIIKPEGQFNMVKQINLTLYGQSASSMGTYSTTIWTLFGEENKKQWSEGHSGLTGGISFSITREEYENGIKYTTTNVAGANEYHPIELEVTDIYGNTKTFSYENEVSGDKIQAENTKLSPITIANEEKTLFSFDITKEEPSEERNKTYSFNSKTGLVVKRNGDNESAIYYDGRLFGQLEPDIYELGGITKEQIKYHFWYY